MTWYSGNIVEVQEKLDTDLIHGLTSQEAAKRLKENGPNKLKEKPQKTFLQRFFDQLKDVMIIILFAAAVISLGISIYEAMNGYEAEWIGPIVIVFIVLLNAILGIIQESKAEASLESLKKMSSPSAKVIRDGRVSTVHSSELVKGDVVVLEAGDFVPADCRLIESISLKLDESALNGESVPSEKASSKVVKEDVPLGDRTNMVYSGCALVYGCGRAVVVETGMKTEIGKIATILENEGDSSTPLQDKLTQLSQYLGFLAIGICLIIFIVGIINCLNLMEMFMTAISLVVAAIPEGLPSIVTIVLAIGVQRMVAKHAIIRRLPAVETLGSTSVICSDKTGTLTQNRMTFVSAYVGGKIISLEKENTDKNEELLTILRLGTLCTDGDVTIEAGKVKHIGDPTETAIIAGALKMNMVKSDLLQQYPCLGKIPFDSERKLMTTIHNIDGRNVVIVKGAPDILISKCISGDLKSALAANNKMAQNALRVLGIAYKTIDTIQSECIPEEMEKDLSFVGLIGMIDPPRIEAMQAIKECKAAGITIVMITGDHIVTAVAIAKQLGILNEGDKFMTGSELQKLSDEELDATVEHCRVYARVSPSDKIRVIKAWKRKKQVVAMTGDGINDAPALKSSDIACAMGITGTDVAKEAADMILTDDNFATIVTAVKEGRGIYDNIRKAVQFLFSCNMGEMITVCAAMFLWAESPLRPIQLLWVNLITDSLPALALGMEPVEHDVMLQKPRKKDEGIFAHGVGVWSVIQGLLIAILTLVVYGVGSRVLTDPGNINMPLGETMAFATLAITQLVHAFNVRNTHSLFKIGFHTNKYMLVAFAASLSLILLVLFVPFLQTIFKAVLMPIEAWLWVIGLALVPLVVMEIAKSIIDVVSRGKTEAENRTKIDTRN